MSKDGGQLAFISDRGTPFQYDIWLRDNEKVGKTPIERPIKVTSVSRYNQRPVFVPDGKSLLFLTAREWNASSRPIFSLWQVTIQTKRTRQIADSGLFTDPMHWKPGKGAVSARGEH
jgi:Tol biopolymer transport system component